MQPNESDFLSTETFTLDRTSNNLTEYNTNESTQNKNCMTDNFVFANRRKTYNSNCA